MDHDPAYPCGYFLPRKTSRRISRCTWAYQRRHHSMGAQCIPAIGVAAMLTFAYILAAWRMPKSYSGHRTLWLSFAAVIIGEGIEKTGLAKRLACDVSLTGGSFNALWRDSSSPGLCSSSFFLPSSPASSSSAPSP
ncbi:MAG: hypothetical protein ACLRWP_07190 [Bilophila wadsworthia]